MSVSTNQLTLNLHTHDVRYPTAGDIIKLQFHHDQPTAEETEDWLDWQIAQQACQEYDLEEPDRFALGVDARAVFEERAEYRSESLTDYKFWRKLYVETQEKLIEADREYRTLNEWAQRTFSELEEYKKREVRELREHDAWCDRQEAQEAMLLETQD